LKFFTPRSIYTRFESHGVPLKIEKDGRVFPVSDNGKDIVKIFEKMFEKNSIDLHCKEGVETITKTKTKTNKETFEIETKQASYKADYVIITT
jgi:predicted flavoprotein YhiN